MINLFKPTWYINSIYQLKPKQLKEKKIEGLIVDLDNTLLAWNQYEPTEDIKNWLKTFRDEGLEVYLLSNNKRRRVAKIAEPLDLEFSAKAFKPCRKNFKRALDLLQLSANQVVVVGDQIITDIIGANRTGLQSILVKPIVPHDNIYTWVNRTVEKILLKLQGIDRHADWGNRLD